jgi:nucleoside-diphosphate-sugar epimerase
MTAPILVTGGTGTLGNMSSRRCLRRGARSECSPGGPARRKSGSLFVKGDLSSGEGMEAAVEGAEIVVHPPAAVRATRSRGTILCEARQQGARTSVRVTAKSSQNRASAPLTSGRSICKRTAFP